MTFKLLVHKETKTLTSFHIVDQTGAVVGTVSVPPAEANDLQKCWAGARTNAEAPAAKAAAPRLPKLSKKAILRGC